jgi:hypothetical protein
MCSKFTGFLLAGVLFGALAVSGNASAATKGTTIVCPGPHCSCKSKTFCDVGPHGTVLGCRTGKVCTPTTPLPGGTTVVVGRGKQTVRIPAGNAPRRMR